MPVILLPGLDGTGELRADIAKEIAQERPVEIIAYPAERALDYDVLTAYVLTCVPVNGPFVILGESFSGPIAIEIAARSEQVRGLILASSFARHPLPKFFAHFTSLLRLKWLPHSFIVAVLFGRTGTPELKARFEKILRVLPEKIIQQRAAAALRVDKLNRLRDVKAPIMCLHGRFDWLVRRKSIEEIVAMRPDCQICWFDAAHMLLETHPEQAAKAINRFCRELTAGDEVADNSI